MKIEPKNDDKKKSSSFEAITLGTELVAPIILGGLIGNWIDKSKHTGTKWTLILLVVGILIGIYNFIKIVRRLNK
jgi:predicted F0F1-ATPase subunit